jgi:hypothetical protein
MTNPTKKRFTYTIKDSYKDYRVHKKANGVSIPDIITYAKYRDVLEDFFMEISKKMIQENFIFMLPYRLGSIMVRAFKTNLDKAKIDWAKSKEVGKIVKHLNLHTFGYYFGFVWSKSHVSFKNNPFYSFCATSSKKASNLGIGKKGLSKYIIDSANDPNKPSYIKI